MFPLVLLQTKVVGRCSTHNWRFPYLQTFPLVLLQTKVVGLRAEAKQAEALSFPLVLLQTKVVGKKKESISLTHYTTVSISSPSNEGGGNLRSWLREDCPKKFSISSPSNEGGGRAGQLMCRKVSVFPLVLLQTKVVGARFLNDDTARLSKPQIDAPLL